MDLKIKTECSIDAEKVFDKIQYVFMIKVLDRVGLERIYLRTI